MKHSEKKTKENILDIKFNLDSKESISDFNQLEARGWVVERLQQIEFRIDIIITNYFKPENRNDFRILMLNSSIIDLGGKLKLLFNILKLDKKSSLIEEVRSLISIRNGFAHAKITETIHLTLKEDNFGAFAVDYIEVMNAQGKIDKKKAKDYLYEFYDKYNTIIKKLDELIEN